MSGERLKNVIEQDKRSTLYILFSVSELIKKIYPNQDYQVLQEISKTFFSNLTDDYWNPSNLKELLKVFEIYLHSEGLKEKIHSNKKLINTSNDTDEEPEIIVNSGFNVSRMRFIAMNEDIYESLQNPTPIKQCDGKVSDFTMFHHDKKSDLGQGDYSSLGSAKVPFKIQI